MIKDEVLQALNKQINAELYSSYLYLSMSAYFQSKDLPGHANWTRVQAQEELVHAMKIYDHVNERGGRVDLRPIDGPPVEWKSPVDVFEQVYGHEQKVTGMINELVDLSISNKDHATTNFLQWFIDEQVEEEASSNEVLQKIKRVENEASGLFMLDQELASRIFNPPAPSRQE
jgi:ferritin